MRFIQPANSKQDTVLSCYAGIGSRMFFDQYLTNEVSEFLWSEHQLIRELLEWGNFDQLIEGGCGFGRAMQLAIDMRIAYDGCEIVKEWIPVARSRIKDLGLDSNEVRVSFGSVESLEETSLLFTGRPSDSSLILLPFNLFGNLNSPSKCLAGARVLGCAVAIVSFHFDAGTTRLRRQYYENCGFVNLKSEFCSIGTRIVASHGLDSLAYKPETIEKFSYDAGFTRVTHFPISHGTLSLLRP